MELIMFDFPAIVRALDKLLPIAFQYHGMFTCVIACPQFPKHSTPCVFSAPMGYVI